PRRAGAHRPRRPRPGRRPRVRSARGRPVRGPEPSAGLPRAQLPRARDRGPPGGLRPRPARGCARRWGRRRPGADHRRGPGSGDGAGARGAGQRLAGDVIIGADGALSLVARLAGMLDPGSALWGFAVRAYVPGEVPLPLLVLLESAPWRIYPGYGWLFPGADGQANVGIGIGMGGARRSVPLREDLDR